MPLAGWEVLGILLVIVLHTNLPDRWRKVNHLWGLVFNISYALVCLAGFLVMVVKLNGYTFERLGIGTAHLGPGLVTAAWVTLYNGVVLFVLGRLKGRRLAVTADMVKLTLAYPPWAFIQHLLIMGIFMNLVQDWLGTGVAVLVGGLAFGLIHWGNDKLFLFLTSGVGVAWAWSFLTYPNLIPIVISHSILATLTFYWVRGEDKWRQVFG